VVGSPLFVFCKRQDLIGLDVAPPLPTPERRSWLLPGQSNKSARVASLEAKAVTRGVTSHVFFDHAESQMECEIPMLPSTQLAFPWLWLNALFRLLGGDARDLVGLNLAPLLSTPKSCLWLQLNQLCFASSAQFGGQGT
jgi:hypothetical protein